MIFFIFFYLFFFFLRPVLESSRHAEQDDAVSWSIQYTVQFYYLGPVKCTV
eukprot:SAG11_NODE_3590_length_2350_cov_7.443803_1_plen_50_part_10